MFYNSLEALQIHENILNQRMLSSKSRAKFIAGLKPVITDGWLLRYEDKDDAHFLLTPEGQVFNGNLFGQAQLNEFEMGDDLFLLVDLLMELKKEDESDVDK